MVDKISAISPEIIRATAYGIDLHKFIGKWVTFQDGDIRSTQIILSVEIALFEGSPTIGYAAINKNGFALMSQGEGAIGATMSSGQLLSFSAQQKKGFVKNLEGRTLPFEIANQSATPNQLRDYLKLVEHFPAGETIDLPPMVTSIVTPRIAYQEAIISGYGLPLRVDDTSWHPAVIVMDAINPTSETSTGIPCNLLKAFNVQPVPRATMGKADRSRRFDA